MTEQLRNPEDVFEWVAALDHPEMLAAPVHAALADLAARSPQDADLVHRARVVGIDPAYSDTEALNTRFALDPDATGNCVLVAGRRAGQERMAACVVRSSDLADVNHVVKRLLDVRKASFVPMDRAVEESGMEYGAITPVGLPAPWRVLVDAAVAERDSVLVDAGVRQTKLILPGALLAALPGAQVVQGLGLQPAGHGPAARPGHHGNHLAGPLTPPPTGAQPGPCSGAGSAAPGPGRGAAAPTGR